MDKDTKFCPYCGEKIKAEAKKCRFCGEWLDKEDKIICPACAESIPANVNVCPKCGEILKKGERRSSSNQFKPVLVVLILAFIIGLSLIGYGLYQDRYKVDEIPYKSISYVVNDAESLSQKYSARGLLDKIIEQEENLSEYMQGKHSLKEKTGVFYLYYKNLKLLTDTLNYYDGLYNVEAESTSAIVNKILSNNLRKAQIGITAIYDKSSIFNDDNMADYFKISFPKTDILEIIYEGEFSFGFHINDSYLADSYSKYLNKSWQDFINNKKRIYDDLEHRNYFDDGVIIPDSTTVAKWAIMWENFLKTYPNFELKEEVKSDMDMYSSDVLYRSYRTAYKDGKEFLADEVREGCEYYLKYADKHTEIFKKMKKDYQIWKDNNFEYKEDMNNI